MIGRLVEDLFFLIRFLWFFKKAPKHTESLGFCTTETPAPFKERAKWAWVRSVGGGR